MVSSMPLAMELAMELCYPASEGVVGGCSSTHAVPSLSRRARASIFKGSQVHQSTPQASAISAANEELGDDPYTKKNGD